MAGSLKTVQDKSDSGAQRQMTGSRIRARRLDRNLRQSELAQRAGISPSYLNLIEHNRRRIGGKLLINIARALDVEPSSLTEGAQASLVGALNAAAAAMRDLPLEVGRTEEFAGRFPGWAKLIAAQARRLEAQERAVEALNDRLTHDPFLNASLHDVLSTVTAIRSTAAILNEGDEIETAWRDRFHRNLYEDSRRLAGSSQALVAYLDRTEAGDTQVAPLDEAEAAFAAVGWDIGALTAGDPAAPSRTAAASSGYWRERFASDAERLPRDAFVARRAERPDPVALAATFGTDVATVLRRWALLPEGGEAGLVVCDGSGTPTFRRSITGFTVPSFGAGCPLWPLYEALTQPGIPIRAFVEQAGRMQRTFLAYAASERSRPQGFDGPVLHEATMLLIPDPPDAPDPHLVGPSCRVCSRRDCLARREPSVLGEA